MLALDEGQVLGRGEREARRQQPLRATSRSRGSGTAPCARARRPARGCGGRTRRCRTARRCRRRRSRSRPSAAAPRSRAWRAISTARRSCGRPPPEKIGSFWPRTRLFIRSSVVTPVSMKSRGTRARHRVDRQAVDAAACSRAGDRRPAVDHLADAVEHAARGSPGPRPKRQRLAEEAHHRVVEREPDGRLEHLDGHERRRRSRRRGRAARGRRRRAPRPRRAGRRRACAAGTAAGPRAASRRLQP